MNYRVGDIVVGKWRSIESTRQGKIICKCRETYIIDVGDDNGNSYPYDGRDNPAVADAAKRRAIWNMREKFMRLIKRKPCQLDLFGE